MAAKLQPCFRSAVVDRNLNVLLQSVWADRDSAWLRSLQGAEAGAWMDAIPFSGKLHSVYVNFVGNLYLTLVLPMPTAHWISSSECRTDLDCGSFRLLSCKSGGGRLWHHNSMMSCWSECLQELHLSHYIEPRNRYYNIDDRPDIQSCLILTMVLLWSLTMSGTP